MDMLVTGGAGFIGSNLVKALIEKGEQVDVIDNLSSGKLVSLRDVRERKKLSFHQIDLLDKESLVLPAESKTIFHLAANPEVRLGFGSPEIHFEQNVAATFNLLEAARKIDTEELLFTSTSTVYGDAQVVPTPEDYSPMEPISMYGASKLACESIMISYAHTYGIKTVIFRLANIIGADSTHGVIYDFVNKLLKDSSRLEVLGDGTQNKSYLHISDCISAMLACQRNSRGRVSVYNIGSTDQIQVRDIAATVVDAMRLEGTKISLTGGVDNGRGWKGDVKNMLLDVQKVISLGWKPRFTSLQAVRITATDLGLQVMQESKR